MNSSAKIKIAITDDHQIVIDGLTAALRNFPHIEIAATATSGAAMLLLLDDIDVDLLLTDIMMPSMDGQELSKKVRELFPSLSIIALSMNSSGEQVARVSPFINAYLLKQCGISELVTAIETVHKGGTYFDATVQEEKRRYIRSQQTIKAAGITPREKQIIQLLEKDLSNKEIASQLCISVRTVETHRKNILRKTGATNVLTLIKWAYKEKLIE